MTEKPPTRAEVQARRKAIADSAAHYRHEFNRGTLTVATCLNYLWQDCPHPPEARESGRCKDCGKLLD